MPHAAVIEMPPAPAPAKKKEKKVRAKRERGEGRIYQMKGRNVWMVQYYQNGRQIRESSKSTLKSVAVELLRTRLTESRTGAVPLVDAKKVSYESMRDALYDYYRADKLKSLFKRKDGTWCLGTVPPLDTFFKGCMASQITYNRLMAFVKDRQHAGKSPATINRSLTAMAMMLKLAVKAKRIPASAVPEFPRLKEPPPREDYFTQEEYDKVSAQLPDYVKPIFAVGYYCGMRAEEILSRKWNHVDFDAGLIRLLPGETKNDDGRIVPMIGPVADMLRALRAANPQGEYVFTRGGQPIKDFRAALNSAIKRAGFTPGRKGHTFHGTRRSAITMHADQGIAEDLSMLITGHRDSAVHRRYRQARQKAIMAAAAKWNSQLESTGHAAGHAQNAMQHTDGK